MRFSSPSPSPTDAAWLAAADGGASLDVAWVPVACVGAAVPGAVEEPPPPHADTASATLASAVRILRWFISGCTSSVRALAGRGLRSRVGDSVVVRSLPGQPDGLALE